MKSFSISACVSALVTVSVLSISPSVMAADRYQSHFEYGSKWQPHACDKKHSSKHEAKRCEKYASRHKYDKQPVRGHGRHSEENGSDLWAKAPVSHVSPIYEKVKHFREEKSCGYQEVRGPSSRKHNDSITDELIGGVIGGAIGNAIGANSTNKKIQAVIGAAIGASIAHDLNQRKGYDGRVTEEYRCTKQQVPYYRDELTGYQVTYHYQGREFRTVMDEHPGKHVRVRLALAEVYP